MPELGTAIAGESRIRTAEPTIGSFGPWGFDDPAWVFDGPARRIPVWTPALTGYGWDTQLGTTIAANAPFNFFFDTDTKEWVFSLTHSPERPPRELAPLLGDYIDRVAELPFVVAVSWLRVDDGFTIITELDAPPFELEPRDELFVRELETLRRFQNRSVRFRLVNRRESSLYAPENAQTAYQRSPRR